MNESLLEIVGVTKEFRSGSTRFTAVADVDISLRRGESVAVVGESGSGKTTTARMAIGLEQPTSGRVLLKGVDSATAPREFGRQVQRSVSMVFQDPYNSLNPRMSIARNVEEPLRIHRFGDRAQRELRVAELFDAVGLQAAMGRRRPRHLSGGQRQRVAIARALALDPELVILDEPVSALDVSVQAQVLNLLADLRERRGLAYLFISHDLAVVRHIAERTVVMYQGRVVEHGPTESVLRHPKHPYTAQLIAAAKDLRPPPEPEDPASPAISETPSIDAEHWAAHIAGA